MNQRPSKGRRAVPIVVLMALVLVLLLVTWAVIEPRLLFVRRSVVWSPDVPPGFDGARIAFVSDVHAGSLLGEGRVNRVVDSLVRERCDVILLGGDYVAGGSGGCEMWAKAVRRLRAPGGVIGVLGNHDNECPPELIQPALDAANILVLENESARVRRGGDYIRVAGIEDLMSGRPDVREAARDIPTSDFAILLSHNPDALPPELPGTKGAFDLALAGHTHGGQITAFGLWAPYTNSVYDQRFRGGWSEIEGVPLLVSRGAGVLYAPLRFFAFPEIHVIELRNGPERVEP